MNKVLKRYVAVIFAVVAFIVFIVLFPAWRGMSLDSIVFQEKTMLLVIPPIFILLGLLDVWVPREKMIRYMGTGSGPFPSRQCS